MCDYSLAHFPNRLAKEGEHLIIHRFQTQSLGLAPERRRFREILFPGCVPAVCVPPGTKLLLHDIPEKIQRSLGVDPVEVVTFVQKSPDAFVYRDAVRFSTGDEILLQCLERGQRVDVLSLCEEEEAQHSEIESNAVATFE